MTDLHSLTVSEATTPEDVAIVAELIREYAAALPVDVPTQNALADATRLPGHFAPPLGRLLLARADGVPAGCVAIRPLGVGVAELKRFYVRPSLRGGGIGTTLLDAAVRAARDIGYGAIRLGTFRSMAGARALYERRGFTPVAPYAGHDPLDELFYELRLAQPTPVP